MLWSVCVPRLYDKLRARLPPVSWCLLPASSSVKLFFLGMYTDAVSKAYLLHDTGGGVQRNDRVCGIFLTGPGRHNNDSSSRALLSPCSKAQQHPPKSPPPTLPPVPTLKPLLQLHNDEQAAFLRRRVCHCPLRGSSTRRRSLRIRIETLTRRRRNTPPGP